MKTFNGMEMQNMNNEYRSVGEMLGKETNVKTTAKDDAASPPAIHCMGERGINVVESPNDPSSPTAKIQVGNNEAPKEPFGAALWLGHIWKSGSNLKIEVIPNGETLTIPIKYILTIINSSEQYDENNEYYLSQ